MKNNDIKLFYKIIINIKCILGNAFILMFRIFPIKNNRIIVISYNGKEYGDNGKYIVEELIKQKKQYEIYWALNNIDAILPSEIKKVRYKSLKYYYILVTSKVWINNCRFTYWIKKRKKQFYIQVWHGNLALKKIEFDVEKQLGYRYIKCAKNDNNMIDCLISNSDFCTNTLFRKAFKNNKKIYNFGTPRNDILINYDNKIINKVKNSFHLKMNEKILLYAPTFRKKYNGQYNIDFDDLIKKLNKKYKSSWKILLRLHPNVSEKASEYNIHYNENVLNASSYEDMQELIISSDLIITDYSSVMFDGLIAKKPVLLYTSDIEEYNMERGTYFKLEDLPFIFSINNEELGKNILNKSLEDIVKNYENFISKINLNEKGTASLETSKLIKNVVYGGLNEEANR